MSKTTPSKPVVMCFSGLDPGGGAGISADIETLHSLGCHCAPLVSALTVQDSRDVSAMTIVSPALLLQQARTVLGDMEVGGFKIGLLGGVDIIDAVVGLLGEYPEVPVVVDPVLKAGGGFVFGDGGGDGGGDDIVAAFRRLLPRCTVLTPNLYELHRLAAESDDDAAAAALLDAGCDHILLTGADDNDDSESVINRLYSSNDSSVPAARFTCPRLPHEYHGSGCTLAAAVAGYLARGLPVPEAVQRAQQFTWDALSRAHRPGRSQHLPDRSHET